MKLIEMIKRHDHMAKYERYQVNYLEIIKRNQLSLNVCIAGRRERQPKENEESIENISNESDNGTYRLSAKFAAWGGRYICAK